jgi:hypothetical protein
MVGRQHERKAARADETGGPGEDGKRGIEQEADRVTMRFDVCHLPGEGA